MKFSWKILLPVLFFSLEIHAKIFVSEPASVGFSPDRLERISPAMNKYIEAGKLPGVLTLIAKDGEVIYFEDEGYQDIEASKALQKDTLFRLFSMTKPVTAVAAAILWEQGKFHMFDPVVKYFPEFKDLQVYVSGEGKEITLEPMKTQMRIIDLFMHTSGFSYGFSQSPVDKLYQQHNMYKEGRAPTTQEFVDTIAKLPLNHQPGTKYNYSVSIDILGVLVERISGQRLGEFMQEHIFSPLSMTNTSFLLAEEDKAKLATLYTVSKEGKTVVQPNEPLQTYQQESAVHAGGAGLISTMHDYYRFTQMLLNKGSLDGKRILGRKTVEYMTTNHLPDNLYPFEAHAPGEGYGLGMSVTVDPSKGGFMSSKGNYGWGGLASTYFRIDPKENMVFITMSQFIPLGFHPFHDDLRNLVYQALE